MDTLSHYLWTVVMYWQHPKRWWIGLWGAIPDLLSFGLLFAVMLFTHGSLVNAGPPPIGTIPTWVPIMYSITHSLVVCATVLGLLALWRPEVSLLMLGWPLHIFIDLPTHTTGYFPTPLLWPLSDWRFSGFSWGTGWFMMADLIALLAVYLWLRVRVPRKVFG